jgi:hypothetical protein
VSASRLQLKKVDFHTKETTAIATVSLRLGASEYVSHYEASKEESPLRSIALATFGAVNEALRDTANMTVEINLRVAEEMHPIFMAKSLFIVIVDVKAGTFAVVADSNDGFRATAAAALDALNRLVQRLLMLNALPLK